MTTFGTARCALHDVVIDTENTCEECEESIAKWYDEHGELEVVTRYEIAATLLGISVFIHGRMTDYRNHTTIERWHLRSVRDLTEQTAEMMLIQGYVITVNEALVIFMDTINFIETKLFSGGFSTPTVEAIVSEIRSLHKAVSHLPGELVLPFSSPVTIGRSLDVGDVTERVESNIRHAIALEAIRASQAF